MRRLLALAAALAVAAGPLAAGQVWAKDHGGPRGEQRGGGEGRWAGERGGPPAYGRGGGPPAYGRGGGPPGWRGGDAPPGWQGRGEGRREEPRYEPRYDPRSDPRYDPRYESRDGYGERGYAPPPRSYATPRRGGYLGPQGGAPIEDPGRYRLREAPRGYMWVRVPGGMAMVSQATGQVFDVVPDGR